MIARVNNDPLISAEKQHVWHPLRKCRHGVRPITNQSCLVEGQGSILWDSHGREYIRW